MWLSNVKPQMPAAKESKVKEWVEAELQITTNQRCQDVVVVPGLAQILVRLPPLSKILVLERLKRYLNGNFKACSLGRL